MVSWGGLLCVSQHLIRPSAQMIVGTGPRHRPALARLSSRCPDMADTGTGNGHGVHNHLKLTRRHASPIAARVVTIQRCGRLVLFLHARASAAHQKIPAVISHVLMAGPLLFFVGSLHGSGVTGASPFACETSACDGSASTCGIASRPHRAGCCVRCQMHWQCAPCSGGPVYGFSPCSAFLIASRADFRRSTLGRAGFGEPARLCSTPPARRHCEQYPCPPVFGRILHLGHIGFRGRPMTRYLTRYRFRVKLFDTIEEPL